jgi:hypothetical protein
MTLDFTIFGEVKITMIPHAKEIVQQFKEHDKSQSTAATLAAEHLFKVNDDTTPLTERQANIIHNLIAKCLYIHPLSLATQSCQNLQPHTACSHAPYMGHHQDLL